MPTVINNHYQYVKWSNSLPSRKRGGIVGLATLPSVYPDACRLVLERRTLPGENAGGIIEEFQAVLDELAANVPELDAELTQGLARPATQIPNDSPLVEGLDFLYGDLGEMENDRSAEAG